MAGLCQDQICKQATWVEARPMETTGTTRDHTWFVAIGASGGDGLADITDLLRTFDSNLNAVVMVVLHRLFDKLSNLQDVLNRATKMPVIIAKDDGSLKRGHCYIGTPAFHLTLLANTFSGLVDDPGQDHRNRTVDLLFKSVAAQAGSQTIGIVLSGSLDDGSRGLGGDPSRWRQNHGASPTFSPACRDARECHHL
jgi:chemotaxis response regulator CheB